jgi:hypothetical protein
VFLMQLGSYALNVLVNGRPCREYGYDGRTYVVGRLGADFTVRLSNRTAYRAKAVLAIDGLSAIDGKPAARNGAGYILDPFGTLDVPGWRLSDDAVARFVFKDPQDSYAQAKGAAENVGVIAAAFYEEEPAARQELAAAQVSGTARGPGIAKGLAAAGPEASLRAGGGSLGTGFGQRADHKVRQVPFTARPGASSVIEVRYEDSHLLRGLGLDVDDEDALIHAPEAFPAGYCAPPRQWRA